MLLCTIVAGSLASFLLVEAIVQRQLWQPQCVVSLEGCGTLVLIAWLELRALEMPVMSVVGLCCFLLESGAAALFVEVQIVDWQAVAWVEFCGIEWAQGHHLPHCKTATLLCCVPLD